MLEDFTIRHTKLTFITVKGSKVSAERYRLQGDPRRRVIPQAPFEEILIHFGKRAIFSFNWHQATSPPYRVALIKAQLARIAQQNTRYNQEELLDVPHDPGLPATAYEEWSKRTPAVPKEWNGKPTRLLHYYEELGSGAFGTVYRAVDLATGSLWAVKECRRTDPKAIAGVFADKEHWKLDLKKEVENLARVQHVRLPLWGVGAARS